MEPVEREQPAPIPDSGTIAPSRVSVAGHEIIVFAETRPLLDSLLADIHSATIHVWVETYIFLDDAAGRAVAQALIERARSGVQVRLHYDAIGSQATGNAIVREMVAAGVDVHCFHSFWEGLWRFRPLRVLNRRNHRKLVVIDERIAYFGGMNVADPISAALIGRAEQLPNSAGWRDVHLRLVGPQVKELAGSFDRSWQAAHGKTVESLPRRARRLRLSRVETEWLQFFDTGPGRQRVRVGPIFTRLLHSARQAIWVSMAYFLPIGGVLRAFLAAARRGVAIRVITPGESDVPLVQHATRYLYDRLLRRRIRVYERHGTMLHSKVLVVDDEWSIVGSSNLDPRSLRINLELVAVIRSRELAHVLTEIARYELSHSTRITLREARKRSWWERLKNRLAWALRWWL